MMTVWLIASEEEECFWSNSDGWGHFNTATRFSEDELELLNLPMGGVWLPMYTTEDYVGSK